MCRFGTLYSLYEGCSADTYFKIYGKVMENSNVTIKLK